MSIDPSRPAAPARALVPRRASSLSRRATAGVVALLVAIVLGAACAESPVSPVAPETGVEAASASVASLPSSLEIGATDDTTTVPADSTGPSDSMPWWRR